MTNLRPLLVVDASIALKWFLNDEDHGDEANHLLASYQAGRLEFVSPDHFVHEVSNGLRRAVTTGRIGSDDALGSVRDLLALAIPIIQDPNLYIDGMEISLRTGCGYYDAVYLALAEALGVNYIHDDGRLHRILDGQFANEVWIDLGFDLSREPATGEA